MAPSATSDRAGSGSISSSSGRRGSWLMSSLVSFAAGALSTSFLWYLTRRRQQQRQHHLDRHGRSTAPSIQTKNLDENENDSNDDEKNERNGKKSTGGEASPPQSSPSSSSFLRLPSMDDIKNRIGELPSLTSNSSNPRKRWPWDRVRRTNSRDEEEEASIPKEESAAFDNGDDMTFDVDDPDDSHSSTCIGSIFGLDVGGTLAKLVYFEERKVEVAADSNMERLEQRRSRTAAAAQAVLLARTAGSAKDADMPTARLSWIPQSFDDEHDDDDDDDGSDYHNRMEEEEHGPRHRRARSFSASLRQHSTAAAHNTNHVRTGSISSSIASHSSTSSLSPTTKRSSKIIRGRSRSHQATVTNSLRNQHRHSKDSEADLRKLYDLRQESVPANLHAYAETYPTNVVQPKSNHDHDTSATAATTATSSSAGIPNGDHKPSSSPPSTKAAAAARNSDGSALGSSSHVTAESEEKPEMPRAKSMLNLSTNRDHKEALDRFYNFARRLDSYREGIRDDKLTFYSRELGGDFHFIHFETRRMQNAMDLIRAHNLHRNISKMGATGGGAHRFADVWQNQLGVAMDKQEELDSLVAGMQFLLSSVAGECYTFRPPEKIPPSPNKPGENPYDEAHSASPTNGNGNKSPSSTTTTNNDSPNIVHSSSNHSGFSRTNASSVSSGSYGNYMGMESDEESYKSSSTEEEDDDDSYIKRGRIDEWWWSRKVKRDVSASSAKTYPYLLVTIGTGVSILRVDGPRKHERISGSTIGGGTYWGLIRLLTSVERFEDVLRLAERGDPSKVDMMVGDIYGSNPEALEKLGLPANLVASSFGKLVAKEDPAEGLKEEDLARALLLMVTNNIGQVAYLNAQLYKTSRIYFVGNFLRQNRLSQRRLSFAIDYWSKGEMEALFLEHEGYFGALGAFLLSQDIDLGKHGFSQWKENQNGRTSPTSVAAAAAEKRKLVLERQRSRTIANFLHI